jgi:hypothetical protein
VRDERTLPQTFVDYEEHPREYMLSAVNTVLDVHTRVSDLYSAPYNQITEQLRLIIESVKERQESELINNTEYGLLHNIAEQQKMQGTHGRAHAGRSGRTADEGLERARLFSGASQRHRGIRTRMYSPRRTSSYRPAVWFAVCDVAGCAFDSNGQAGGGRRRQQDSFGPYG